MVLVDSVASWGRRAVETTSAALSPAVTSAATQDSSAPMLLVVHPRLTKLPLPMRPSRREAVDVGSMVYHINWTEEAWFTISVGRKKHGLPYQLDGRSINQIEETWFTISVRRRKHGLSYQLDVAALVDFRVRELYESRSRRPGLPVPNNLYSLCGRKTN